MNRTKLSALNAVSALLLTLTNGLLGIVVTRLILSHYGSDFNGINSTVNQIINVLLILEGGFTLASNVALFGPVSKNETETANGILAATRTKFRKIGVVFFAVGIVVSVAYALVAKTQLRREFVFTVLFMTVVPQAVNLYFTTTYRVLLQTQQKEYIISGFTALTIGLGHLTNICIILLNGQMWLIRFVTMIYALLNCMLISVYTRKKNRFIDFAVKPRGELIKGTNDVMAQKITGVIYTSWPIVFLSISSSGGSLLASVYAVYNNIFVMIKALLHGLIDAPRLGFGQMLTEKDKDEVWPTFKEYEFIAVVFVFIMMTTACGLILPFIRFYTQGVTDVNYYDIMIATLMVLIGTVEMLHIPSGHIINMSGNFRISKIFQIIACVVLIASMSILGSIFDIYGMLFSLLFVAILLAVCEIGFVHTRFFFEKLKEYIFMVMPFLVAGVFLAWIEMKISIGIDSILSFIVLACIYCVINMIFAFALGFAFDRRDTKNLLNRAKLLVTKYIKKDE